MSSSVLLFPDTETTGLDENVHEVWELAALRRHPDGSADTFHRFLTVTLQDADPNALDVGAFHDRYRPELAVHPDVALQEFCAFAARGVLLGLNISFDTRFLSRMFAAANQRRPEPLTPTWHYSAVDIKSLAAGALSMPPPWRSDDIAARLGVNPADYARHEALADCEYAAAMYDAAMTLRAPGAGEPVQYAQCPLP